VGGSRSTWSSGFSERWTKNWPRGGLPSAIARGLPCRISRSNATRSAHVSGSVSRIHLRRAFPENGQVIANIR
jgi:hypothetical protein